MLSDFLRQAATSRRIVVRSSPDSEKDHVSVEDVVDLTLRIASGGAHRIYNIAAGRNTRQGDLLAAIAAASGCAVEMPGDGPVVTFVPIDVRRIRAEFGFVPRDVLADIPAVWQSFADHFGRGPQICQQLLMQTKERRA
jgi:nucleoside-diphosphate-sugar epimerase